MSGVKIPDSLIELPWRPGRGGTIVINSEILDKYTEKIPPAERSELDGLVRGTARQTNQEYTFAPYKRLSQAVHGSADFQRLYKEAVNTDPDMISPADVLRGIPGGFGGLYRLPCWMITEDGAVRSGREDFEEALTELHPKMEAKIRQAVRNSFFELENYFSVNDPHTDEERKMRAKLDLAQDPDWVYVAGDMEEAIKNSLSADVAQARVLTESFREQQAHENRRTPISPDMQVVVDTYDLGVRGTRPWLR